jgi:hypothetical protein
MNTLHQITPILQVIVAFGLLNVWILRFKKKTPFRGGAAASMSEEFRVYGLPHWALMVVGTLKVGIAVALIAGLRIPELVPPATILLAVLMIGALVMHIKVKDPLVKSLPALAMLIMTATIFADGFMRTNATPATEMQDVTTPVDAMTEE